MPFLVGFRVETSSSTGNRRPLDDVPPPHWSAAVDATRPPAGVFSSVDRHGGRRDSQSLRGAAGWAGWNRPCPLAVAHDLASRGLLTFRPARH